MPTERELELMEAVIDRARAWAQKPTSVELRQKVEWALQDLESFRDVMDDPPTRVNAFQLGGTQ
jgi:hypothetical protein